MKIRFKKGKLLLVFENKGDLSKLFDSINAIRYCIRKGHPEYENPVEKSQVNSFNNEELFNLQKEVLKNAR